MADVKFSELNALSAADVASENVIFRFSVSILSTDAYKFDFFIYI